MFVSETYGIEDCTVYIASVSSTTSYNISLPSNFKATAIVKRTSSSSSTASLHMGIDTSNRIIAGQRTGDGTMGLLVQKNGSWVVTKGTLKNTANVDAPFEYTYQNNVSTFKYSTETLTDDTNQITPSKLIQIEKSTNGSIRDIKIKPL